MSDLRTPSLLRRLLIGCLAATAIIALPASAAAKPNPAKTEKVISLKGYPAPGTPDEYNVVKVLKDGDPKADNVLVLVPGTSGGAAYFRPLAKSIVKANPDYQVWSVERRENLLEDHSELDAAIAGNSTSQKLFDYYLGWLGNPNADPNHFKPVPDSSVPFAREWGMQVAVGDLRQVIRKARKEGHSVVLGGHSLGGSIITAYASWDFNGKPGAKGLDGLVYIDGGSLGGSPPTADAAATSLANLQTSSPFLDLLGVGLPWAAGIFNATGSTAALQWPDEASVAQSFPLLPANLKPPVPATNRAQYGYGLDADTNPPGLALVRVHVGQLAASGDPRGWQDGELGSIDRVADAFSGIEGMDGTAWYHPRRLSIDAAGVNNGIDNPAQPVFGERAIHGDEVDVPIYAFETSLGWANGQSRVIAAARQLAAQSGVKPKDTRYVSKPQLYAHIDPLTAAPDKNAFLKNLNQFLKKQVG